MFDVQKSIALHPTQYLTGWRYIWPLMVIMVLLGFCLGKTLWPFFVAENPYQEVLLTFKQVYWSFWKSILISHWFYIGAPILLLMQLLWPVQKNVKKLALPFAWIFYICCL
jgi:hypothetical protein